MTIDIMYKFLKMMSKMFIKDYLYIMIYNLSINDAEIIYLWNRKLWSLICFINWNIIWTNKSYLSCFYFNQEVVFSDWKFIDNSLNSNKEFANTIACKFNGLQALSNFQNWNSKKKSFKNMLDEVTIDVSKASLVGMFIKNYIVYFNYIMV